MTKGLGDLSPNATARDLIRAEHRADLRREIERLQARRASSHDAKTQARLDERIRIAQGRLGRA